MLNNLICCTLALTAPGAQAPADKITTVLKKHWVAPQLRVLSVCPAPTGSRFAVSLENNTVRIMDAASQTTIHALSGHPQPVYGIAFNPKGTLLASGDETARIWLWDAKTGKKVREFSRDNAHIRGIQALSFSSDGKILASTGKDDVIILWNVATGKKVRQIVGKGLNFYGGTFVPGGGSLATGTLLKGMQLYPLKEGVAPTSMDAHAGTGVISVAFNLAGTLGVAAGRDGKASVWSIKGHKKQGTLSAHTDSIVQVAISPSGKYVATSSTDRLVILWDLATFKPVAKIEKQSAVGAPLAFTRDGKYLISADEADGLLVSELSTLSGAGKAVKSGHKAR